VSVEQNNSINDTTYGLASGNSLKYIQDSRGATRNAYRTTTFRSRFSDRKATRNDAGSSLFDRKSNTMVINTGCHFEPSKTAVADYAAAAVAPTVIKMENKDITGVFAMECYSIQTRTVENDPSTYTASAPVCSFVARAENFFFDRANTNSGGDVLQLNVFEVNDQSTSGLLTTTPDEQLFNLGDKLVDNRANGGGLTYSNDGSCNLPSVDVVAAGAAPGDAPAVATGVWINADSNRILPTAAFAALATTTPHYSDSHFLSYRPTFDSLIGGQDISFKQLKMISVAIQASAPEGASGV
jgi:hypothetical protein